MNEVEREEYIKLKQAFVTTGAGTPESEEAANNLKKFYDRINKIPEAK